jgi:putative phage-type endonuclease
MTEEQWIEMRKGGVGASDVATVCNYNPFSSPYELWAKKTDKLPDDWVENERQRWGQILEPAIADEYAERSGHQIIDHGRFATHKHPELSVLYATVDREIVAPRGPGSLECKNTREYFESEWATGGPMMYRLQLQAQLEVMGWDWGALAVLIGGGQFMSIEMERDRELGEMMLEEVGVFWEHVQSDTPPPVDGSVATMAILKKLHPQDSGETIVLSSDVEALCDQRAALAKQMTAAKKEKAALENVIFEAIGDATWGELSDGTRMQWRVESRKGHIVEPSEPRVLRRVKGGKK